MFLFARPKRSSTVTPLPPDGDGNYSHLLLTVSPSEYKCPVQALLATAGEVEDGERRGEDAL
jgi:hypothetical protein